MKNDDLKNFKLTVYLLKESVVKFRDAISDYAIYTVYNIKEEIKTDGYVIIGQTKENEPSWKSFIQEGIKENLPPLYNSSNRAVIFYKIDKRYFAIPFGYGKHLLKDECIDREFGLKTALNIINADKLLSVDKANIGDLSVLTKTQASKKGSPDYFNIDIIKDLIRSITGEPELKLSGEFGNVITGNEGIYISPKTNFAKVPEILGKLKREYHKTTYKQRFDWIDNIKVERDPTVIDALNATLIGELIKKNSTAIHLAPPFILNWEDFIGIAFTPQGDYFYEFDIKNFYKVKNSSLSDLDWEKLVRQKLYIKENNNEDIIPFALWRFINFETVYNGKNYVFTLSNWYKINSDYYKSIYEYCSQIEESDINFLTCNEAENEGEYNERMANSSPNFICLDKKLIRSNISRSEIEACDIFTKSKELIHVKFRESSSTLSHLFAQGRISCNSLRRDKIFRKNLRAKIKNLGLKNDLIPLEDKDFDSSEYTITYAIIEKKNRSFIDALPFFSLINFRLTAEELMVMGFKIKVKKIMIK